MKQKFNLNVNGIIIMFVMLSFIFSFSSIRILGLKNQEITLLKNTQTTLITTLSNENWECIETKNRVRHTIIENIEFYCKNLYYTCKNYDYDYDGMIKIDKEGGSVEYTTGYVKVCFFDEKSYINCIKEHPNPFLEFSNETICVKEHLVRTV
jgi:hypothetical protein